MCKGALLSQQTQRGRRNIWGPICRSQKIEKYALLLPLSKSVICRISQCILFFRQPPTNSHTFQNMCHTGRRFSWRGHEQMAKQIVQVRSNHRPGTLASIWRQSIVDMSLEYSETIRLRTRGLSRVGHSDDISTMI